MTTENTKTYPTHRVSFSKVVKKPDGSGTKLGCPREIGAVWPRKNGKKGGIIALDHIPIEMTQGNGVIFLVPNEKTGGAQ